MALELLLDDPPYLVFNKPGGLLTQSPPGIPSLEAQIREYQLQRNGGEASYLGLVHRLDRPASGAIVFGCSRRGTRRLAEQFQERRVRKIYWALVEGQVAADEGTWQDNVWKVPGEPRAEVLAEDDARGRLAILHYRVLRRADFGSWLEIQLETGRTHQIRLQASSRGHPVLGDEQYGSTASFGPETENWRARWIALHARRLEFWHPTRQELVGVDAPLPEAWLALKDADFWQLG